jgi:hypothetical protein
MLPSSKKAGGTITGYRLIRSNSRNLTTGFPTLSTTLYTNGTSDPELTKLDYRIETKFLTGMQSAA